MGNQLVCRARHHLHYRAGGRALTPIHRLVNSFDLSLGEWKMVYPKRRMDSNPVPGDIVGVDEHLAEVPENSLPTVSPNKHCHHCRSPPPFLYTVSSWHPGPTCTIRSKQNKVGSPVGSTYIHRPLTVTLYSYVSSFSFCTHIPWLRLHLTIIVVYWAYSDNVFPLPKYYLTTTLWVDKFIIHILQMMKPRHRDIE